MPSLFVSPGQFRAQMAWLKRLGYRGLSLRDADGAAGRVVAITFDDGFADCVENALPILLEFGFTATCFLVSDHLDDFNRWDHGGLHDSRPTMSTAQAGQWLRAGMEIGSHTCSHPHLPQCPPAVRVREMTQSKSDLESRLGAPVDAFCYPYGDFTPEIAREVEAIGYRCAVTTQHRRATAKDDRYALPRFGVNGSSPQIHFLSKLVLP